MNNKTVPNKEQLEAIQKNKGAYSIIASAGSGKSFVLLSRIDNLIKKYNVAQRNILAISFTRNTAEELQSKLTNMGHPFVNVGTFHSICGKILREEGIDINPSNMIQEWQIDNCFKQIDKKADVKDIMGFIGYQKSHKRGVNDEFINKASQYSEQELREYYKAYEKLKKKLNRYDFDDYLLLCLEVVKKNPGKHTFEYILVDEYQDSNGIQNELLKHWCISGNLFTCGDFRQNIYGFNGSSNDYIMNMNKYWNNAETLNVYINYRSPQNIVEHANNFIKRYYKDYEHYKDAASNIQEDGHIQVDSRMYHDVEAVEVVDEIEKLISNGTKLNDIAVLYRNNAHADFVENELKRRKIDYDIANDSSFFKRREIAGI